MLRQTPSSGAELDPGNSVVIIVARRPNTVDVPRVVGLDVADAFERVQAAGLRAKSVEVFARQAKGRVVRQRPPARAEARRGATVVLTSPRAHNSSPFHRWRAKGKLPPPQRCGGSAFASTSCASRRRDLCPRDKSSPRTRREGSRRRRDRRSGSTSPPRLRPPAARPRPCRRPARRPFRASSARATPLRSPRLQAAGFRVSSTPVSSTRPAGTVLTQSPAGGTTATRGSTVRITVSGGRQVRIVPDVVGETAGRCGSHPAQRRVHGASGGQACDRSRAAGARRRAGPGGRDTRAGHHSGDDLRRPPGLTRPATLRRCRASPGSCSRPWPPCSLSGSPAQPS